MESPVYLPLPDNEPVPEFTGTTVSLEPLGFPELPEPLHPTTKPHMMTTANIDIKSFFAPVIISDSLMVI
jgi:hypothetical protein